MLTPFITSYVFVVQLGFTPSLYLEVHVTLVWGFALWKGELVRFNVRWLKQDPAWDVSEARVDVKDASVKSEDVLVKVFEAEVSL